jgi:hypothetical protein
MTDDGRSVVTNIQYVFKILEYTAPILKKIKAWIKLNRALEAQDH